MSHDRPLVLVFPGASLMEITATSTGVLVRCPGCEQVQHMMATAGAIQTAAFLHKEVCPVQRRIQTAIRVDDPRCLRRG
jgi:hypothetical protein